MAKFWFYILLVYSILMPCHLQPLPQAIVKTVVLLKNKQVNKPYASFSFC